MIYILAAGKSSRFGSPKLLETFKYNKLLFDEVNLDYKIVTTENLYKMYFTKLDKKDKFIFINGGNGSGQDTIELYKKVKTPFYLCWSDVFFTKKSIQDILDINSDINYMTVSYRKNPYINIEFDKYYNYMGYSKDYDIFGYQDNSIFYITDLDVKLKFSEFLDILLYTKTKVKITTNPVQYFNTKIELEQLKL